MRFYIVDSAGLPAVIEVSARDELPKRLLMGAELAVNLTSGMTVRKAPQTRYSMPADISHIPKARLILGQTHIGIDMNGDNALVWRLGYERFLRTSEIILDQLSTAPGSYSAVVYSRTPYLRPNQRPRNRKEQ